MVEIKEKSEKQTHNTLLRLNMEEEKYINNLVLIPNLSSDSMEVLSYQIKKIRKTNRKADPMISERPFDKSYINETEEETFKTRSKIPRSGENKRAQKGEREKDKVKAQKEEDNRPWYQRYFWLLAIVGMIGYNIMTFDKQKLKDAMEAANQQQNATQGRN